MSSSWRTCFCSHASYLLWSRAFCADSSFRTVLALSNGIARNKAASTASAFLMFKPPFI